MFPKIPDIRLALLGRPYIRHPGLVPGTSKKATEAKDYTLTVIPGSPRDLIKRPRFQNNPCRMFPKIPDIRCAIPGRPLHRHPGLAPGTNKKAVISKQPLLDVS